MGDHQERHVEASSPAERHLNELIRSELSRPQGRFAVVLHLSRMHPPALRPHHRRMALMELKHVAGQHDGQTFSLGNGDLVLLYHAQPTTKHAAAMAVSVQESLQASLAKLLRDDGEVQDELLSFRSLETSRTEILAYVAERLRGGDLVGCADEDMDGQLRAAKAASLYLSGPSLPNVMHSEIAIHFEASGESKSIKLRPLYRGVAFSAAKLLSLLLGHPRFFADTSLLNHLSFLLDARVLELMLPQQGHGGSMDVLKPHLTLGVPVPLFVIKLTLMNVLSVHFRRLEQVVRHAGGNLGVEISLLEAVTDPHRFGAVRMGLAKLGCPLVLGDVTYSALLLSRPWELTPGLLKLIWSPQLLELAAADASTLQDAFAHIGTDRIVMCNADTKAALHWGTTQGIRRFEGGYINSIVQENSHQFASSAAVKPAVQDMLP